MKRNALRWRSLKTRTTLFTLGVFLISIWTLFFYASRALREEMTLRLGEQQLSTASIVAAAIDHELDSRFDALRVAADLAASRMSDTAALERSLEQQPVLQLLFNGGIIITGSDGTAIADLPLSTGRIGVNYANDEWVSDALKDGRSSVGRPIMGKVLHVPVFPMTVPIRDPLGQVAGTVSGVVDLARPNFLDAITNSKYGHSGGFLLIAPQYRRIVTASDKRRVMEKLPALGVIPTLDRLLERKEGTSVLVDPVGEEVLSASKLIPASGWHIVVSLPTREAFAPIYDLQRRMLLATLCLTLIAGCLTWWMLRRQLSPLAEAADTLAGFSDLDRPPRALPIARPDEVGQLIGSFNRLLEILRRREEALHESDETLRSILAATSDGYWRVNRQGRLLDVNSTYSQQSGFTREELLGMRVSDLEAMESESATAKRIQKIVRRGNDQFESVHRRKDGSTWHVEVSTTYHDVAGGQFYAFVRDITERKRTETLLLARLRISELAQAGKLDELLRATLNAAEAVTASRFGTFHLVDPDGRHVTLRAWSTSMEAHTRVAEGKGQHRPIAGVWAECIHNGAPVVDNDRAGPARKQGVLGRGATVTRELAVPILQDGKVTGILRVGDKATDYVQEDVEAMQVLAGMLRDVLDRQRAEGARQESDIRFRALVEQAGDGFELFDDQGRYLDVNTASCAQLGYSREELLRLTLFDINPDLSRERFAGVFESLVDRPPLTLESVHHRKDGGIFPVEVTMSVVRTGEQLSGLALVRDISGRKRLEQARLTSQKLESLGTLAGGIAHDFNNILTAIVGNADLAAEQVGPEHIAAKGLGEIIKASARASELVRRIMAFARPREAKREVVDLSTVVDEVLKLLRSTVPATISLKKVFAEGTPQVRADVGQVHEAIVNLTTNAAYAIGAYAGSIEYRLEPVQVGTAFRRRNPGVQDGTYARLTVKDDGYGMDAATLGRIFDAFYTTKPVGKGAGLGLSMVHGTMRAHGGVVTVESIPGRGSSFALYFPAAEETAAEEKEESPEQDPAAAGRRILYVDDEEALVSLADRVFSRMGHRVSSFTDPEEALEAFRSRPQDFEVVMTDLSMPHMSGFDLARKVLAVCPEMPVLMLTGHLRAEDERLAQEVGIRELMLKPVKLAELDRVLRRIFAPTRQSPKQLN